MNKFKVKDSVVYRGATQTIDGSVIVEDSIYEVSELLGDRHIRLKGFFDTEFHVSRFVLHKEHFHSSHYESDSIEPIEFAMSNKMDFCRASIVKYAYRAGKKDGQEVLDIKKIIDYAMLLAIQEGINFTKEDAQSIIDYRFQWKEDRKCSK